MPTADQLAAQITQIFQGLFGRNPASGGLTFWTNAVLSGSITDDQLPMQIALSAAPADEAYFEAHNPTVAAQVYSSTGPSVGTANPTTTSVTTLPTASGTQSTTPIVTPTATTTDTSLFSSPLVLVALAAAAYLYMKDK